MHAKAGEHPTISCSTCDLFAGAAATKCGSTHIIVCEQLGEKQDFECALTALDLPHEDFALRVVRMTNRGLGPHWSQDYRVTVTCLVGGFRHVYIGGPRHRWVARCAEDLARHGHGLGARGQRVPRRVSFRRWATEAASGQQRVAE